MSLYAVWFAVTVLSILLSWRREVVRQREARRAFDMARHPAGGRFGATS